MKRFAPIFVFICSILLNARVIGYVDGVKLTKQMLRPRETVDELVNEVLMYLYGVERGYLDSLNDKIWAKERNLLVSYTYNRLVVDNATANEGEMFSVYRHLGKVVKVYAVDCKSLKEALKAYREIMSGARWADILNKYSSNVRLRNKGGFYGEVKWSYTPDRITRMAFSMREGEVSFPFRFKDKWYIIKVSKIKDNEIGDYQQEKIRIKNLIIRQKKAKNNSKYWNYMKHLLNIKFNEDNLKKILKVMPRGRHMGGYVFPDSLWDIVLATSTLGNFTVKELQRRTGLIDRPMNLSRINDLKHYIEWELTLDGFTILARNRGYNRVPSVYSRMMRHRIGLLRGYIKTVEIKSQKISEDSLLDYYYQHIKDYTEPERRRVYVIVNSDKEKLKNVRKRILKGAEFSKMAKKYSIHLTRNKGGDLGWITRNRFPEFSRVAFKLKNGQVSDVFSPDGKSWAIVYVNGIQKEKPIPFGNIKNRVRREYEEYLLEKRLKEISEEMKKKVKIKILKEDV